MPTRSVKHLLVSDLGPDFDVGMSVANKLSVNIDGTTLTRDVDGKLAAPNSVSVTSNNGLSRTVNSFQLGGPLIKATSVDGNFTLSRSVVGVPAYVVAAAGDGINGTEVTTRGQSSYAAYTRTYGNTAYGHFNSTSGTDAHGSFNTTTGAGSFAVYGRTTGATSHAIYGETYSATSHAIHGVAAVAGGYAGYFTGNIFYSGALTPSDIRLKENIQPFENPSAIESLQIYTYDKFYEERLTVPPEPAVRQMVEDALVRVFTEEEIDQGFAVARVGVGKRTGVLAQDVQLIFPDLVHESPDGFLALDTEGLFMVLLKAHQLLASRVAAIEPPV